MRQATDKELLAQYGAGNQTAFAVLYQRHIAKLTGILLKRCGNEQMAADHAHDALTTLSVKIADFDIDRPVMPWLKKVGINAIRSKWRKEQPTEFSTLANGSYSFDPTDIKMNKPDEIAALFEDRERVHQALAEMPKVNSQALKMVYFEGLTPQAAADGLKIKRRTLRDRLEEGAEMLKRWMRRNGASPD